MCLLPSSAHAEEFDLMASQVGIAVAPGYDHVPVSIAFKEGSADLATLTVNSDQPFVSGSIDVGSRELRLAFTTRGLVTSQSTATVTVSGGGHSEQIFVTTSLGSLDVVQLLDDPVRSITYGLHDPAGRRGAVIFQDPVSGEALACLGVGRRPSDFAISADGSEMMVICPGDKQLWFIDLGARRVSGILDLPDFGSSFTNDWSNPSDYRTTSNVAYGKGGIIYYTDEAWAPTLRVLDRASGSVVQTVDTWSSGVGDFAINPAGTKLVTWAQYGYGAGQAGSHLTRYAISSAGTLTKEQETPNGWPNGLLREPYNTPMFFRPDGSSLFVKQYEVLTAEMNTRLQTIGSEVYGANPPASLISTKGAILDSLTGNSLLSLPVEAPVQAFTSDSLFFVYFHPTERKVRRLDLVQAIGPGAIGLSLSPAHQAIVTPPQRLTWSPVVGVDRYAVFLGTDEAEVRDAGPDSPAFLGEVIGKTEIAPGSVLLPGVTYFWRVSPVTPAGLQPAPVYFFTVSDVSVSPASLAGETVAGHDNYRMTIALAAETATEWSAATSDAWLSVEVSAGTTPAQLVARVDASKLAPGFHAGSVSIQPPAGIMEVPVALRVVPLHLTHLRSDPESATVYAISEHTAGSVSGGAYLLELDADARQIRRVVPVGSEVTDFEIHKDDARIYVANWGSGRLLALSLESLELERSYGFSPRMEMGYGGNDVYRIAVGGPGRLIVEEQDQWIEIRIMDTATGAFLGSTMQRQGGGETDPTRRWYFHGDDNISNASIHKFDLTGDTFTSMNSVRVTSGGYYGSRVVTVSADGSTVFWNGAAFGPELNVKWDFGGIVTSTSHDGRLAFGATTAWDLVERKVLLNLPASTGVNAYNDASKRLVFQAGEKLQFLTVDPDAVPGAPQLAVASVQATSATLSWAGPDLVSGYTLQRLDGMLWQDVSVTLDGSASSHTVAGLSPETTYSFRIKSHTGSRSSAWSEPVTLVTTALPPPTPSLSFVSATDFGKNTLTWTVTSFAGTVEIFRALADTHNFEKIGEVSSTQTTFVDATAALGIRYSYKVRSVKGGLFSTDSQIRTVTSKSLATPEVWTTGRTHESVNLQWSGGTLQASGGMVYLVERWNASIEAWVEIARVTAANYQDKPLAPVTTYRYRVTLTGELGAGEPSQPLEVTTLAKPLPAQVGQLRLAYGEGTSLRVSWQKSVAAEGYRIERRIDQSTPWSKVGEVPGDTFHFNDSALTEGFRYSYRVTALNEVGAASPSQEFSLVARHHSVLYRSDFSSPPVAGGPVQFIGATHLDLDETGAAPDFGLRFDQAGLREVRVDLPNSSYYDQIVVIGRLRYHAADDSKPDPELWEPVDSEWEYPYANAVDEYVTLPASGRWEWFQFGSGHGTVIWQPMHDGPGLDTWTLDDLLVLIPTPPLPARVGWLNLRQNAGFNVALDWNHSANAHAYRVERSADGLNWLALGETIQPWYVDESIVPGAEYLYRVIALNITGPAAPSPIATASYWGDRRFDFGGFALTLQEAAAIKDHDGMTYLEKFAFGLQVGRTGAASYATDTTQLPKIVFDPAERRLVASFMRRRDLMGTSLIYEVQVSRDAMNWTKLSGPGGSEAIGALWEKAVYRDSCDANEEPVRFMRIQVKLAP